MHEKQKINLWDSKEYFARYLSVNKLSGGKFVCKIFLRNVGRWSGAAWQFICLMRKFENLQCVRSSDICWCIKFYQPFEGLVKIKQPSKIFRLFFRAVLRAKIITWEYSDFSQLLDFSTRLIKCTWLNSCLGKRGSSIQSDEYCVSI